MPSPRVTSKSPWHLLFILDDSGSMEGEPAEKVNRAMKKTVDRLKFLSMGTRPYFRVSVITFGTHVKTIIEHQSEQSILDTNVCNLTGESGTTNAAAAFETAKNLLEKYPGQSNHFVPWIFFTCDGVPDDKNLALKQAKSIKSLKLAAGTPRIACLGFGSVNDRFMEQVASHPGLYKKASGVDFVVKILPMIGTRLATTTAGSEGAEEAFRAITNI